MNWESKKVLLTGGSSGIGAHLVSALALKGAQIAFVGMENDLVNQVATKHGAKGYVADLRQETELVSFFEEAVSFLGGIDILINNAGYVIAKPFEELKRSDFENMFAINTIAPARLAQLALPYFKAAGAGDIVNIGATGGAYAFNTGTAYSASKSALSIVSKNLTLEHRNDNVRTFHIDPSKVTDTQNGNFGTPIPKNEERLKPFDLSELVVSLLEMNRRAFVPQMSVWNSQT